MRFYISTLRQRVRLPPDFLHLQKELTDLHLQDLVLLTQSNEFFAGSFTRPHTNCDATSGSDTYRPSIVRRVGVRDSDVVRGMRCLVLNRRVSPVLVSLTLPYQNLPSLNRFLTTKVPIISARCSVIGSTRTPFGHFQSGCTWTKLVSDEATSHWQIV